MTLIALLSHLVVAATCLLISLKEQQPGVSRMAVNRMPLQLPALPLPHCPMPTGSSQTRANTPLSKKSLECLAGVQVPSPGSGHSPDSTSKKACQMVTPPQGGSRPLP
ncbi:hypothetical protein LEMLEM_LOCUS16728 [Lemmus lemmus]